LSTSTAAEAVESSIWVRWTLDHMKAWVSKNLPSMEQRIDPDYSPEEENDREVMRILRQLIARPSGNSYHEGGNGEKRLLTWILTILSGLTVGAVFGGVAIYGKVASIEKGQVDHDRRIESLERINERRYRGPDAAP
jgi:hypothetical protein